jgi:hypothetical protein
MLVRLVLISFAFTVAGLAMPKTARAQKPGIQKQPNAVSVNSPSKEAGSKELGPKDNPKDRQFALTPAREAAVMAFVDRNHAELAGLLSHLKTNQPKEYERAVRDLFRVTEKLAMTQERDSRQYDLELKAWQAQSRAQLLVARLKMTDPDSSDASELKNQLREVLSEQMEARLEVMRLERERVSGRLDKLNQEITRLERDREKVIDGHVKNLTSQVNANRPKIRPAESRAPEKKPVKKP